MSGVPQTPANRCLSVAEWPPVDRALWTAALTSAPDQDNIVAHWSKGTRAMVVSGHGRWLNWRAEQGLTNTAVSPSDLVSPESLDRYVTFLRETLAEYSVAVRVEQLGNAMRVLAPERNWLWMHRIVNQIRIRERARRAGNARPVAPPAAMKPNRSMPFAEWPALDRAAWTASLLPGDALDAGGVASRWASRTLSTVAEGYGRWLTWLTVTGVLDPLAPASARIPRWRLRAFMEDLKAEVAPFTVAARIEQVGNAMRALAPGIDWRWIQRAANRLRAAAVPVRDKRSRLRSPEELVACGKALMIQADDPASGSPRARAARYRDGLMIAFLPHRPIRAKNLVSIEWGGQLTLRGTAWWVVFPASEIKTLWAGLEFPFPAVLAPCLWRYLEVHRPVLLAAGDQTGPPVTALWVSKRGLPLGYAAVAHQVRKHTAAAFGQSLSPHLFRDAVATAIAINVPKEIALILPILGHTTLRTSERHYNQAGTLEAGRRHARAIAAMRRVSRGRTAKAP